MSSLSKSLLKTLTMTINSLYVRLLTKNILQKLCCDKSTKFVNVYKIHTWKKNESNFNVSEDIFIFIRHLSNLYCINYNVALLSKRASSESQRKSLLHVFVLIFKDACVWKKKAMTTVECYLFPFFRVIFNITNVCFFLYKSYRC